MSRAILAFSTQKRVPKSATTPRCLNIFLSRGEEMVRSNCPLLGRLFLALEKNINSGRLAPDDLQPKGRSGVRKTNPPALGAFWLLTLCWIPLALSGCGGAGIVGAATGSLEITPSTLTFGSVSVGKTSSAAVSIVNQGS